MEIVFYVKILPYALFLGSMGKSLFNQGKNVSQTWKNQGILLSGKYQGKIREFGS